MQLRGNNKSVVILKFVKSKKNENVSRGQNDGDDKRNDSLHARLHYYYYYYYIKVKVKVPLQAWAGPEGFRKLRFPDFVTTALDGGKVVSLTHRPPLHPQEIFPVLISVRG